MPLLTSPPRRSWLLHGGAHTPTIDGYYTTKEAADELGLSHVTMRDAVRRGVIEAKKVARRSLIPGAEVERYRAEHLGQLGWDKRKAPGYVPNEKLRDYQRASYQRKKAARKQQEKSRPCGRRGVRAWSP